MNKKQLIILLLTAFFMVLVYNNYIVDKTMENYELKTEIDTFNVNIKKIKQDAITQEEIGSLKSKLVSINKIVPLDIIIEDEIVYFRDLILRHNLEGDELNFSESIHEGIRKVEVSGGMKGSLYEIKSFIREINNYKDKVITIDSFSIRDTDEEYLLFIKINIYLRNDSLNKD